MHKCLSAEISCINVETEPRTYCCGGGTRGTRGRKYFWGGWQKIEVGGGKSFWKVDGKIFLVSWQNFFEEVACSNILGVG